MMGCVISPFVFIMSIELMLRGAADTAKEEIVFLSVPSWMTSKFLSLLCSGVDELLLRYHKLFTWARVKAKLK